MLIDISSINKDFIIIIIIINSYNDYSATARTRGTWKTIIQ